MKKFVVSLALVLLAISLGFGQVEYKKFNRLGIAPLVKDGVWNVLYLDKVLNTEKVAVTLCLHNEESTIKEFYQQLSQGMMFQNRDVQSGERIEVMSFRNWEGKILKVEKLEWAGTPFAAFTFDFAFEGKKYFFIVPKICGNICLEKIESVPMSAPVKKAEIREFMPEPKTEIKPEPPGLKKPALDYFASVAFGGFYSCFMEYAIGGIGARRNLFGPLDLVVAIGIGAPIGSDASQWDIVPMINFGIVGRMFAPFYLGAGIAFSGKMKESQISQLEFTAEAGFAIKKMDIFFRGQVPLNGDPRGITGNYKIITGIRVFFGAE